MQKLTLNFLLIILLAMLSSCTSVSKRISTPWQAEKKQPLILTADGFSQHRNFPQLTQIQNHYATEQTATLVAYRALAKQLYRTELDDDLVVADQVIKHEYFRTYFDLFLREARVVDKQMIADQQKISLALTITPRFYECISSTTSIVSQCLLEDDKTPFTRIGYQQAPMSTVNLSCAASDCSHQLRVSGFSQEKFIWDRALLNIGLYDSEWSLHTGLNIMLNYLFITGHIFN